MITHRVDPAAFLGERVEVVGDAYRHLFRARRAVAGERVRVVDGLGAARWAIIDAIRHDRASLRLLDAAPANDPGRAVDLLAAPPKPDRAAWLVEKAAELGVRSVRFVATARAARELGDGAMARLRRVAVAALEQAQGSRLPELSGTHAWGDVEGLLDPAASRFVLDAGAPLGAGGFRSGPVALLIGPEGGWTAEELVDLAAAGWQARSLGSRVLRLETAAILAAGMALATAG